jgi:hypothetical protein
VNVGFWAFLNFFTELGAQSAALRARVIRSTVPVPTKDPFAAALIEQLLAHRNSDGGWGYYPGKLTRLEPTSQALIALTAAGQAVDASVLDRWPMRNNLFVDVDASPPNIAFHAQAVLALRAVNHPHPFTRLHALIASKGMTFPPMDGLPQDNSLQGWSWRRGTTSWAEPTAWALIALKAWHAGDASTEAAERIDAGEQLLADRMCRKGGWNYGSSMIFNTALPPHGAVSALGLLALADKQHSRAARTSLEFLHSHRLDERSASALALSLLALRAYEIPADDVDEALHAQWEHTQYLRNTVGIALALSAVTRSSVYRGGRA